MVWWSCIGFEPTTFSLRNGVGPAGVRRVRRAIDGGQTSIAHSTLLCHTVAVRWPPAPGPSPQASSLPSRCYGADHSSTAIVHAGDFESVSWRAAYPSRGLGSCYRTRVVRKLKRCPRTHGLVWTVRGSEALLRAGRFFTRWEETDDGRAVFRQGGRAGDVFYRDRWSHDKVVRSTHGVNCTGSCSWKIYVKDGIITWESQADRLSVGRA